MFEDRMDFRDSPIPIPEEFWDVRYNADHFPGAPTVRGVDGGANCQQYAYTVLRHFGFIIPDFRSSDLWEDRLYTQIATSAAPFDLVLVHNRPDSYGAHVGLLIGNGLVLHLSRQIGAPAIEALEGLQPREQYRHLVGFKTVLTRR